MVFYFFYFSSEFYFCFIFRSIRCLLIHLWHSGHFWFLGFGGPGGFGGAPGYGAPGGNGRCLRDINSLECISIQFASFALLA